MPKIVKVFLKEVGGLVLSDIKRYYRATLKSIQNLQDKQIDQMEQRAQDQTSGKAGIADKWGK